MFVVGRLLVDSIAIRPSIFDWKFDQAAIAQLFSTCTPGRACELTLEPAYWEVSVLPSLEWPSLECQACLSIPVARSAASRRGMVTVKKRALEAILNAINDASDSILSANSCRGKVPSSLSSRYTRLQAKRERVWQLLCRLLKRRQRWHIRS